MQTLSGRRHRTEELAFSHCGRWLAACGSSGGVHVWDTSNPTAKPLCPLDSGYACTPAFRSDGRLFFSIRGGRWFLFDPAENELQPVASASKASYIRPSPGGTLVANLYSHSPMNIWGITEKGKAVKRLAVRSSNTQFRGVAFSRDETAFVTAEWHSGENWQLAMRLVLRDAEEGKPTATFEGGAFTATGLQFSSRGDYLFAYWASTIACWTVPEPSKPPRKATNPGRKHFLSLAVHPEGPLLTVDNDRLVRVWDVPSLATDRTIEWNIGKLYAVAVSPDGTRVAVGSHTGKVLVWDWD